MKTLICILIFTIGCLNPCNAQILGEEETQTPQELYDFHMEKRKANVTAGWISLGGGLGLIALGVKTNVDNCLLSGCNNGMPLVYLGSGLGISSLILFEKARSHKSKAKIQLQRGAVGFNNEFKYTGISLTLTL